MNFSLRGNISNRAILNVTERLRCQCLASGQFRCWAFVNGQFRCILSLANLCDQVGCIHEK